MKHILIIALSMILSACATQRDYIAVHPFYTPPVIRAQNTVHPSYPDPLVAQGYVNIQYGGIRFGRCGAATLAPRSFVAQVGTNGRVVSGVVCDQPFQPPIVLFDY